VRGDVTTKALEEAWAEFRETAQEEEAHGGGSDRGGFHVGTLEAMELLREAAGKRSRGRRPAETTPQQQEQARFFDWLLHVKQDKVLAYEFLRRVGTLAVGPREYWASDQGGRRAIAWESRYTYPGSDSEIWDMIYVDEAR
jgi:hypothetical protein